MLDNDYIKPICPHCGTMMSRIEELHDEIEPAYRSPYYECWDCGLCLPIDYDFENDDYEEEEE